MSNRILAICVFSFALLLALGGSAHAQTGDMGLTDGYWGKRIGTDTAIFMAFADNGACIVAVAKKGTIVKKRLGRYLRRGNLIVMNMYDGGQVKLRFAIRGNKMLIVTENNLKSVFVRFHS